MIFPSDSAIRGIVPIVPTPFLPDGSVGWTSIPSLIEFAGSTGACAVCLPAYASEFYKLTPVEHERIIETALTDAKSHWPRVVDLMRSLITMLVLMPLWGSDGEFAGRWDLIVHTKSEDVGGWLEYAPGAKTKLNIVPRVGGVKAVSMFEVRNGRLTFSNREWFGKWEDVRYDLTSAGGKIAGTARRESGETMTVEGVRAPTLDRKIAGWGQPVALLGGPGRAGWKVLSPTKPGNWSVADGVLTNNKSGPNLRTIDEFQDFQLDVEFNCPAGSNSGIFLRGRYEIQIEEEPDNDAAIGRTGAVYQFLAPQVPVPRRPGEWRRMSITLVGRSVSIVLDGVTLIARQEIPGPTSGGFNSREEEPGPIILQGDHGAVAFRNIVITPAVDAGR